MTDSDLATTASCSSVTGSGAQMNWNGMLEGAVYGFVEDPEEGWSPIECRLELLKISDETYTDAGYAIEWCIKNTLRNGQGSFGSFCS